MAVDVVAVAAAPMQWAAYCDICNDYVSSASSDSSVADTQALEHEATHA